MDSSSDSPSSYRSLSPRNVDSGLWSRLRAQARNATQKEPLPSSPRGSISSPRRRSPRSRSSSPRKKSVGSGSGSPTLAKRRGGQSPPTLNAPPLPETQAVASSEMSLERVGIDGSQLKLPDELDTMLHELEVRSKTLLQDKVRAIESVRDFLSRARSEAPTVIPSVSKEEEEEEEGSEEEGSEE